MHIHYWIPFRDHPPTLERHREDGHGPCSRMTRVHPHARTSLRHSHTLVRTSLAARYEGQWAANRMHGKGLFTWSSRGEGAETRDRGKGVDKIGRQIEMCVYDVHATYGSNDNDDKQGTGQTIGIAPDTDPCLCVHARTSREGDRERRAPRSREGSNCPRKPQNGKRAETPPRLVRWRHRLVHPGPAAPSLRPLSARSDGRSYEGEYNNDQKDPPPCEPPFARHSIAQHGCNMNHHRVLPDGVVILAVVVIVSVIPITVLMALREQRRYRTEIKHISFSNGIHPIRGEKCGESTDIERPRRRRPIIYIYIYIYLYTHIHTYITLYYITLNYITLCYVMLCYVM